MRFDSTPFAFGVETVAVAPRVARSSQPSYIHFRTGLLLVKEAGLPGSPLGIRSSEQAGASGKGQPLSVSKNSSQPSLFPGFTRLELEQLPEPDRGREASSVLVL